MAPTQTMPESELARMTNVEIAEAVEQKKLSAEAAGAFLLTRFTNKVNRRRAKAQAEA